MRKDRILNALSGAVAGAVNGLFGAGGGMILVPLLTCCTPLDQQEVFPASVSIILPICIVSLTFTLPEVGMPFAEAWPYLLGSIPGGLLAGFADGKIPVKWLHRGLCFLILWGGVRYLW
jgi:uncharacterized membrane protein YfcA